MKPVTLSATVVTLCICSWSLTAQDEFDEATMFGDTSSVVDSAKIINTAAATAAFEDKKSVGWSGEVNAWLTPSVTRSWFNKPRDTMISTVSFPSRIVGNGQLDIRLLRGVKAFADLEASYVPVPSIDIARSSGMFNIDSGMVFAVPEFFIDANFRNVVYVRAGKQVLQWGRCFLWNPTDFVNVEKKTFFQRMGHREGAYGVKMHIPYKTLLNFYSFVDLGEVQHADDVAVSAKAEALVGRTEMAVSVRGKREQEPIFGFDISTQLFEVQISGEAALRSGRDMTTLHLTRTDTSITDMGDAWIPRASVNLMKFFPLNGVADRIMVSTEFYYNHAGYDPNVFDGGLIDYQKIIATLISAPRSYDFESVMALYEPNSYSRYYAMLSTSISRFILNDMTFTCSAVGNLSQKCAMLTGGVTYTTLHDFTLSANLNGFVGKKNTEYTFTDQGLSLQVRMGLVF
jgi:hypothetical protein